MSWTAVSGQTYNVRYRQSGTSPWTTVNNVSSGQSYTTGIAEGRTYEWQIETEKSCGSTSGWSSSSTVNTATCTPPCTAPALPANRTDSASCNAQNDPRITLNWTTVAGQTYNVRYRESGATNWTVANNVTSGQSYTTNIGESKTYQWQVETEKSCGSTSGFTTSSTVDTIACGQPPAVPSGFNEVSSCTSETDSNNVISWGNVANANNYQIRYRLSSQGTGVSTWANPNTSADNSFNLNNVDTDATYIYQVLARNNFGSSAWSANQTFTTDPGTTCQRFTISGNIFIDDGNTAQIKGAGESNFCSGTNENRTIRVTGANGTGSDIQPSGPGCGGFSITNLRQGNYTVSYNSIPTDYTSTYPVNQDTNGNYSFNVRVQRGGSCSETHLQASCNAAGNINDLNFGIVSVSREPWFQSVGGDVRSDIGKTNNIPDGATCSNTTTDHVSAESTALSLDPGLVYSASLSDLGGSAAKANRNSRIVVGKKFTPARVGQIRTSYTYISSVFAKGGITPEDLFRANSPKCSGASPTCTLPGSGGSGPNLAAFPNGTYRANNGLTIPSAGSDYTFPTNSNYIILVSGNLTINRNIIIPTSSTVIFAATGNIIIGSNVTRVDGVFSADQDFRVLSAGAPDSPLTVQGNIIANAALRTSNPGILDNQRDLGATQNNSCPSLSVRYRPDFILHAPATIKYPNYIIQEVAP